MKTQTNHGAEIALTTTENEAVDPSAHGSAGPECLLCIICRKPVTDPKKLDSPGAKHLGLVVCSFECAQQLTIETGMC